MNRFAALVLTLGLAATSHAQRPDAADDTSAAEPVDASSPLTTHAVMTGEQVVRILDETVDWYRMLGVQQQSATQPSDLLILYANRQAAASVVDLAFELANANAELLSSQAELQQREEADAPDSPQALQRSERELTARRTRVQTEIAAAQRQLEAAAADERADLQAKLAELQSELELVNARRNLVANMLEFAHESGANGSGVTSLKAYIAAIEASIPDTAGVMPQPGVMQAPAVGVAAAVNEQVGARRFGIWDLGANVLRLQGKLATIDEVERRTEQLQETFTQIREAPEDQIRALSARGDALGSRPPATDAEALRAARAEYDTIAWLFAQTSAILVPLQRAGVLLDQYRNNLESWREATRSQYRSALKTLAARAALLLLILGAVVAAGELWKRAVFSYVQEQRRRHQLLLIRRIVLWVVALVIITIAFATEASSFATFAGLLTAGIAVAMQSVLVSIVGYFFLVGKYGLRVGDRVQIGAVTGEVIDLGLVRLHLMELGPQQAPTGRVVALANSVVFQASGGVFKQIPGVSLAWREVSLAIPVDADYAAVKERLAAAAERVLDDYREELERQTRELQKTSWSAAQKAQANVQLKFSPGAIEALVRYPVPLQRAAEVEERMSRALLDAIRARAAEPAELTEQPT